MELINNNLGSPNLADLDDDKKLIHNANILELTSNYKKVSLDDFNPARMYALDDV
jgi:hypothetical protein